MASWLVLVVVPAASASTRENYGKAFKGCERIQTEMVSKWQWHANSKSLSPAPADGYFNRFSFKVLYCLSSWGSGHRMMGARFLSVLLSLLGLNLGLGRQCLTDGIPEDLRNFIQNDAGEKIPVGLALADWQSGIVIGKVVEILINEVLGLHAKVHPDLYKTSFSAIYAVGGCLDFNHVVVEEKKCNINETQVHVVLDVWLGKVMSDLRAFETSFPSLAPEDMGSMGYSGFESMYLSRAVFERAYDAEGLALNYHLSYNTSHHNPKMYFQSISDFNVSTMVPCSNGTSFMNQHHMGDYVRWTGDLAGVELQPDGSYIGKCAPFGQPGYWWPAPACRHDTTTCIPVITSGNDNGWFVQELMQFSTAYGFPAAIGIIPKWSDYARTVKSTQSLFYWWVPDTAFAELRPESVVFPPHRSSEWVLGNKRTAADGTYVSKMTSQNLRQKSPRWDDPENMICFTNLKDWRNNSRLQGFLVVLYGLVRPGPWSPVPTPWCPAFVLVMQVAEMKWR